MHSELTTNGPLPKLIHFCLETKLVAIVFSAIVVFAGLSFGPFDWNTGVPRDPISVDAIPDIGENQQIVFTQWDGRSPQDIEDQITYPLTTALLGLPKVKTVRSFSMFGFSSIYVIFEPDAEFYWSRNRITEKLNSLSPNALPSGVTPQLGPDATALGQVFWYTLEGVDERGLPTGGWDLHELRSLQDWYVRYALQGVKGVAEVASVGGHVKEYQIEIDPDALLVYKIALHEVFDAVRDSNLDVGARTIEVNRVEYMIRGVGFIKSIDDLRNVVVVQRDNVPITLNQIARVELGPAVRRGALDSSGAEAVGGVVVTRYGENPQEVIKRVKEKIAEIAPSLPKKEVGNGKYSQVGIVPFYDRTGLINETLDTLENAVRQQLIITILVVVIMVAHLRSAGLISMILPFSILISFVFMKMLSVDANIVALSGIAIAIGAVVDMGIMLVENILKHVRSAPADEARIETVYRACTEVARPILTAVLTTIISFLPVFTLQEAEGKLFQPLAFTKTFVLVGAIAVTFIVLPAMAHLVLVKREFSNSYKTAFWIVSALAGLAAWLILPWFSFWLFILIESLCVFNALKDRLQPSLAQRLAWALVVLIALYLAVQLALDWQPLGVAKDILNSVFVVLCVGCLLLLFSLCLKFYGRILAFLLRHKLPFLLGCSGFIAVAVAMWIGFASLFALVPESIKQTTVWNRLDHIFPGFEKEFMPTLDEGSFLLMPTTMPHASIGEALDIVQKQDKAIAALPEVVQVVGKIGRVDSALDPAPISMIETIVNYQPEYILNEHGKAQRFQYDNESNRFVRDDSDALIPDENGRPFRQWRDHIRDSDDIWQEIVQAATIPGTTSAPKLQPIAARVVMLQSGMRAPMGLRVFGPDLSLIEQTAIELEFSLKQVPSVNANAVFADRIVGKPYLEIEIDRQEIARHGIKIKTVQEVIEIAIGGKVITRTVEGRERYQVTMRYPRELRDSIEAIESILVATPGGAQIPLRELADIQYVRGPQVIKSENTFPVAYVIFDKNKGYSEVEVIDQIDAFLAEQIASGALVLPDGVRYQFTGTYESQLRAEKRLSFVIPLVLITIWLILFIQFRVVSTTFIVFSGVFFAWSGGFMMIWLYGQSWFLDMSVLGINFRDTFQIGEINLSVAVWVGFLALFGIATDNGVLMCAQLKRMYEQQSPSTAGEMREVAIVAGKQRARATLMTTATTILALLPILTSTGKGSEIMVPMAIPTFGGMLLSIISIFFVPVCYCGIEELKGRFARSRFNVYRAV